MVTHVQELLARLWQDRKLELIFMGIALVIPFISVAIYFISFPAEVNSQEISFESEPPEKSPSPQPSVIHVDISGAVLEPDLYELAAGSRLKDVVKKAGGLSLEADIAFFQRNYNLARLVNDQDKIYIPTTDEVQKGMFVDNTNPIEIASKPSSEANTDGSNELKVNINSATVEELDTLPGVGKVTAEKIVENRPYVSIEDLVTKKALGQATFEKVKEMLTTN